MTFVSHAYCGAVAYAALAHAIGIEPGIAAPIVGAVLGSAPDTFDWVGWKLGLFPRWWLYVILHHNPIALIVECLLVAPGIHTVLFDPLIHAPVIPREGEEAAYDVILFRVLGMPMRRRDIHWLVGEALLITVSTFGLYLLKTG